MMIDIYQVDAFASNNFEGNPAAVCPLDSWLPDDLLVSIADENNLSETAFFVREGERFHLRWFTPEAEVDLCGHATLATAHVLFKHLHHPGGKVCFKTRSGDLLVEKTSHGYAMDFPATMPVATDIPDQLLDALGISKARVLAAYDYVVVIDSEDTLISLNPDFNRLAKVDLRGVLVTAPGKDVDFVSRCFFPKLRVNEDPVTGSAHCELAPYWAEQLGKSRLTGRQLSKRSGLVECEMNNDRVTLIGTAIDYLHGQITIKRRF
jgi:PhzF family phenazine biosynthesis protein